MRHALDFIASLALLSCILLLFIPGLIGLGLILIAYGCNRLSRR